MPRFALYVFGPPRLERDGVFIAISRRKTMALLVYLALNPTNHSRDTLATLLWPDCDQNGARSSLRRSLSELRSILGAHALTADLEPGSTVQLLSHSADGSDLWVDAIEFRNRLHGEAQIQPHQSQPPTSLETMSAAVKLYQAHFLAHFTLEDSPAFEEWQLWMSESLKSDLRGAEEQLALGSLKRGEPAAALDYAQHLAELDPEDESAHRLLMRVYVALGQRNTAMAQYELCRRVLDQDLNAVPGEETRQLYESIRAGQLGDILRATRPHHLPKSLASFIGRELEIGELRELLLEQRLVTVTGPGGVGKTRLALRVGEGALEDFEDGVYFVDLSAVRDANLVISAIAAIFKLRESTGRMVADVLVEYLVARHLLLILDNFEQVAEAGPEINALLEAAPSVHALVTSRAILRLEGEYVYHLSPLPLPHLRLPLTLASILRNESIRLFLVHAQKVQPEFRLSHENVAAIAEICRKLDGLPLAIELAAARVRLYSPPEMLAQLDHRLKVLVGGGHDLPSRQQTMRASIAWSYGLLSDSDQLLFRRLAVFVGGCTLDAAEVVCAESGLDVAQGVESLLDKQLLQSAEVEGSVRYTMFETIREFALECLEGRGESVPIHRKYADYYADLRTRYPQELNRLEPELDNLRAVLRWSIESGQVEPASILIDHAWFWMRSAVEYRHWIDALLYSPGAQGHSQARLRILYAGFYQAFHTKDQARSQVFLDEYAVLVVKVGTEDDRISTRYMLALVCIGKQDYQAAVNIMTNGLNAARTFGNTYQVAWFQSGLASALLLLGRIDLAKKAMLEALAIFRTLEFRFGIGGMLNNLGFIALEQKNLPEAENRFKQAFEEIQTVKYTSGLPDCLYGLAGTAMLQGNLPRSARLFGAAQGLAETFGAPTHEPALLAIIERNLAALRLRMEPAALQKAWQEGQQMTLQQALAFALLRATLR
jgi:predicted ATPase/DNA-binding SARP family transcriptional activator